MHNDFYSEEDVLELPAFFFERGTYTYTQPTVEQRALIGKVAQIRERIEKIRAEYHVPATRIVPVPCGADHVPNEVTIRTFEQEGDDTQLPRFSSTQDLFDDLGI